jgi:hypothetical protein
MDVYTGKVALTFIQDNPGPRVAIQRTMCCPIGTKRVIRREDYIERVQFTGSFSAFGAVVNERAYSSRSNMSDPFSLSRIVTVGSNGTSNLSICCCHPYMA